MKKILLLFFLPIWIFSAFSLILGSTFLYQKLLNSKKGEVLAAQIIKEVQNSPATFLSETGSLATQIVHTIKSNDARPMLLERYLKTYSSQMQGLGSKFVEVADKYGLDWRLLPALASKESGLGNVIPWGSFNPFGWAVYTGEQSGANFSSFEEAIEIVGKGLKEDYYDQGVDTPEEIKLKYAPDSSTSWASDIHEKMLEISP